MGDMTREPSMEEILSSIRKVIARDEAQRSGAPRVARGTATADEPSADPAVHDDLSGLERAADALIRDHGTTRSDEARSDEVRPDTPLAEVEADVDDILELTEPSFDAAADAVAHDAADALVSTDSLAASARALETLNAALHGDTQPPAPAIAPSGPITIDAMVEAALRPMLKQWLDANLPSMVERLVAREIARITGGRI